MKVLNIVESAYRATLEEQDDTILWLSRAIVKAGADLSLLLRSNAVNYLVKQECPALQIGTVGIHHPAQPADDLAKLQNAGVAIYALRSDMTERGIDETRCLSGVRIIGTKELPALFGNFDQIWHW